MANQMVAFIMGEEIVSSSAGSSRIFFCGSSRLQTLIRVRVRVGVRVRVRVRGAVRVRRRGRGRGRGRVGVGG